MTAAAAPRMRGRRRHRRAADPPTLEFRAPTALRRGKKDKPLSLDAMTLVHNPPTSKKATDEIEVAWDVLSNTYVCLFDGACRLALEAASPAERAVPE